MLLNTSGLDISNQFLVNLNRGTNSFFQARFPNLFLLACSIRDLFISFSNASLVVYLTQSLYFKSKDLTFHSSSQAVSLPPSVAFWAFSKSFANSVAQVLVAFLSAACAILVLVLLAQLSDV
jgi:hypothetical protein